MSPTNRKTRKIPAALGFATIAILMLAAGPAARAADEDDTIEWDAVLGGQFVSQDPTDSAKFEEFRDVPNGLVFQFLDFTWRPAARDYFSFQAVDVTQEDQQVHFTGGRQDLFKVWGRWVENPRHWTDHSKMLYTDRGNGNFALENTLQSAVRAAPASVDTDLDGRWDPGTKGALIRSGIGNGAQEVDTGWHRTMGSGGVLFNPIREVTLGLQADRDRRTGTIPTS